MASYPRYAIYYAAPRGGALDRFGAEHLGYDAWSGEDLPFPRGLPPDWRDLTSDPRKYGFHATLKAPFALAPGASESELAAACADFARAPHAVPVIAPAVASISGFIAVIPTEPPDEMLRFAADCVRVFDAFRAPLTPEDRARRRPDKLTPRQRDYLDRWGYPYVMDEFRFHMTLTGRLDSTRRGPVLHLLNERFQDIGVKSLAIDGIALFKQADAESRFRVIAAWHLEGVLRRHGIVGLKT
jgi:putative phosphonate metabolism protein